MLYDNQYKLIFTSIIIIAAVIFLVFVWLMVFLIFKYKRSSQDIEARPKTGYIRVASAEPDTTPVITTRAETTPRETFQVQDRFLSPNRSNFHQQISRFSPSTAYSESQHSPPHHPPPAQALPPLPPNVPPKVNPASPNIVVHQTSALRSPRYSAGRGLARSPRASHRPVPRQVRYQNAAPPGHDSVTAAPSGTISMMASPRDLGILTPPNLRYSPPLSSPTFAARQDYSMAEVQLQRSGQVSRQTSNSNISAATAPNDPEGARQSTRSESSDLDVLGVTMAGAKF